MPYWKDFHRYLCKFCYLTKTKGWKWPMVRIQILREVWNLYWIFHSTNYREKKISFSVSNFKQKKGTQLLLTKCRRDYVLSECVILTIMGQLCGAHKGTDDKAVFGTEGEGAGEKRQFVVWLGALFFHEFFSSGWQIQVGRKFITILLLFCNL